MANINFPNLERDLVERWKKERIFERSVSERPEDKQFVFYDGPPFATGLPHYGHIVASTIKDVVPRYATMRGYRVERRWGWDCHGLPIENLIEKDLNLKTKQDIETIGVAKFNNACKSSVLTYAKEWRAVIERLGRWVDMDNDYRTMDTSYTESVWWVFKQLYDKGLIYEGYKAMHLCPRCETTLSNFEVTLGYKDVTDITATVQFQLVDQPDTYILAWTTTPWTLPGNLALAIGAKIDYLKVAVGERYYIVAKERAADLFTGLEHQVIGAVSAAELVGQQYQPLFPYYKNKDKKLFTIFLANFVSTEEGTGIVHIAGGYGEDDYQLCLREHLPIIQHVGRDGKFVAEVTDFAGKEVKPKGNPKATDLAIIEYLKQPVHDGLFSTKEYKHSYPHCWRCDTPLLNYASNSWFVKVTALKEQMIKNNQTIHWLPEHIKDGRFGKWLEGAKDWAISRDRYWGAPLPIWQAEDGSTICVGSLAELKKYSGVELDDVHKQFVDNVIIEKSGKIYKRVLSVLDCWFESGSMPYAQGHYPFEHKAQFEQGFPAQFIAEGLDQTRGWFYTLMVLSTALFDKPAFKNVIVNGLVLAADGKKMSKRLKNYPEPSLVLEKYGADALRFYLMNSPVVRAEDLRFSEAGVDMVMKKLLLTLYNSFSFYQLFAQGKTIPATPKPAHIMDKWVLAYMNTIIVQVTEAMDQYDLQTATRLLEKLVQEISTWYIRRSRDRFKTQANVVPLAVLRTVLLTTAKLLAPFTPFITEHIYKALNGALDSVHLEYWPEPNHDYHDEKLLKDMVTVRNLVEQILALREQAGLKVRQPLASVTILETIHLSEDLKKVLLEEVNVKQVKSGTKLELDTVLTDELKQAGAVRELVRLINALRKKQGLTINDFAVLEYSTTSTFIQNIIQSQSVILKNSTLMKDIIEGEGNEELKVNGEKILIIIKK
ncbi:MAG: isoleucine--tRNA ligase [Patescibacteria group bacterium]|jgi:isoleucyl-tRNA synthetase